MLLRHIGAFVVAVISHWKVLVTGSLISGLIGVWEHAQKRPLSDWPLWTAIGLSLIVAFFLAWRQEYVRGQVTELPKLNPKVLNDLFKSRTSTHASTLVKQYLGKRYVISGIMSDAIVDKRFPRWRGMLMLWTEENSKVSLVLFFSRKWKEHLSALDKGEKIKCYGRLKEVQRDNISCDKCELVGVDSSPEQTEEK